MDWNVADRSGQLHVFDFNLNFANDKHRHTECTLDLYQNVVTVD